MTTVNPLTDAYTGDTISVDTWRTREDDRTLVWVKSHRRGDDVVWDDPITEIGLDFVSATRLAAELLNTVYQSVYVATGTQDSDDCNSLCNAWWGAYEAAGILVDTIEAVD
jgi:hypothetical protein